MTTRRRLLTNTSSYLLLLLTVAFFLLPLVWLIGTAFKPRVLAFSVPPTWFFQPVLDSFYTIFQQMPVLQYLRNSIVVAVGSTAIAIVLGVPAGYGLARNPGRTSNVLAFALIAIRMVPPVAMLIPFYLLMRDLDLLGTYWSLILLSAVLNVSFVAWFMRGYYASVPREMEEAACCDGCTKFGAFARVSLPPALPGVITIALFSFIASWNDFLFAMLLTGRNTRTLPLGILESYRAYEVSWNLMAAVSLFAIVPVILLGLALQRYYVSGLTLGAVRE